MMSQLLDSTERKKETCPSINDSQLIELDNRAFF